MSTTEVSNSSWATLDTREPSSFGGPRDIIAIGAAVGGLSAICLLLRRLPAAFNPAILIALDMGSQPASNVLQILRGYSHLPVSYATDGALVRRSCVVVAPVRHHLSVTSPGIIRLENERPLFRTAPSANRLFETCAATYGPRVIGVVLSGESDDGTAGLLRIKVAGGIGVVQHPEEAVDASRPTHAMRAVHPAYCSVLEAMVPLLVTLASGATPFPQTDEADRRSGAGNDTSDETVTSPLSIMGHLGRRSWLQHVFG